MSVKYSDPKELYDALVWKAEHDAPASKYYLDKIYSMIEWYQTHERYTDKQMDFCNDLLTKE